MLDNSKVIRNKEIIILEKKREETNTKKKKSTYHQQRWILFSTIFLRIRLHRSNAK